VSHTYCVLVYELTACVTSRHTEFSLGEVRGRDHLEDLVVDGRIILKCIFKKWLGSHWLDCCDSGSGPVAGA